MDRQSRSTRPRLKVRVLGSVAIDGPAGSVSVRGRQPRAVTAFLALENRSVTHDELAELLWGHQPSPHWRGAVRGVLSKVRTALRAAGWPADVLRSDEAVVWLSAAATTDLDEIEALLGLDVDALGDSGLGDSGLDDSGLDAVESALDTLAQPFLPDDDSEWGRRTRYRIANLTRRAQLRDVDLLVADGHVDEAIDRLARAIGREPLDETLQHRLIALLVDADRPAAASAAYEHFARHLADEFGITPPAETTALLARRPADDPMTTGSSAAPRARGAIGGPLHPHSHDPFVGRRRELERLAGIWHDVVATGLPHLVILDGPAGAGKTRLADHFCAMQLVEGGASTALWGRNRGYGDRAFGAVAEMIDRAVHELPDLDARLDGDLAGLRPILDDPPSPVPPDVGAAGLGGLDHTRRGLARAVRSLLEDLTSEPTIIVLDDLQWSPVDELDLIERMIDGFRGPLLVIATSRLAPPAVADALARIQRLVDTTTFEVGGLTATELTELFPDPALAATITRRTGGLAFYASELARLSRLEGRQPIADDVPPAIADWVLRRTRGLDRELAQLLELASVVGDDIDTDLVARCSALAPAEVAHALDELVATGLLTQGPASRLQFSHEITREVVYEAIGPATAAHLHRHVAAALITASSDASLDARLAHHFARAGHEMRPQAYAHAMRAGQRALTAGAWERAADHFMHAIELADTGPDRAHASIGLGRAHLGEERFADAAAALTSAADIADDHGWAVLSARAVLALVGRAGRGALHAEHDDEHRRLLRRSIAALSTYEPPAGSDDEIALPEIRSDLERELAFTLLLSGASGERERLLTDSLRRMRDVRPRRPRALANALLGQRYALLAPGQLGQRLADIDEVLALGIDAVGPDVILAARVYQHEDLLRRGDLDAADRALASAERLLETFPHPYWGWAARTWRALRRLVAGDVAAAEREVIDASHLRPGVAAAAACLGVNVVNLRLYQRRTEEVIPMLRSAVAAYPEIPTYRAVLALALAECSHDVEAGSILRSFAHTGFEDLPDDTNRFLGLAVLAHAAAAIGADDVAESLAALLEPYRAQWVVLNCYGGGGAVLGPTAHALGRLERLAGDVDAAAASFAAAAASAVDSPVIAARITADLG